MGMLLRFARQLFGFLRPAVAAHQALQMMGRAVQGDHEQALFGGRAGDPRQGPHFRIAQFAARHAGGDLRQAHQRMGDAHLLACRAQVQTHLKFSQCAQDGSFPSAQPFRRSNSSISVSQR